MAESRFASLIAEQTERIIEHWTARVREEWIRPNRSESELRDHVPVILRDLVAALRAGNALPSAAAKEHGRQRQRIGFDIEAVTHEYALLQDVLLETYEAQEGLLSFAEMRILTSFVMRAVADGITEYNRRTDEREASTFARVEAERQHLLERERIARVEAEAERSKLNALLNDLPVAITINEGPAHVFTFVNPAYRALMDDREVLGKPLLEALPEFADQGIAAIYDEVVATGKTYFNEAQPVSTVRDGVVEERWFTLVVSPKKNSHGAIDGVVRCTLEVTDHVRAQRKNEALARQVEERERELRAVTDALPVLISTVNAELRYGLVNKAYEAWFGQTQDEIRGRYVREVVGEAAYARLEPFVKRGLAGESFSFEQYDVPYRLGGKRDVRVSIAPNATSDGTRDGYVALLEDISARRRLEKERDSLSRQREEVLDSMGDAFFAVDRDWRFVLMNKEAARIVRTSIADTIGKTLWEVFPDAANAESIYYRRYHECMSMRLSVQFVAYSTQLDLWTDVRVYPTEDGGIAGLVRDVTQEKRAELALRRQAEFEQQLIGIVSHDLRNPLNVVLLATSLLSMDENLSPAATKTLMRIQNAGNRATAMVRDLLDFTQGRVGGGIRVAPEPCDLHLIVASVLEEVETTYPNRRVRAHRAGDGKGNLDAERIAQVAQNLITNALKYSPTDSDVEVASEGDGETLRLSVRNTGAPIPQEKLAVIFEPYQRAAGQVDPAGRSVGLGLYIVRAIVNAHRGTIDVQSSEEDGTTFTVELPRHAVAS